MVNNLNDDKHMSNMDDERESVVDAIYDCEENPLAYMIEPKGSVKITDKNKKTKKEDLQNIL